MQKRWRHYPTWRYCGSVTFRYESGSSNPYLWITDPGGPIKYLRTLRIWIPMRIQNTGILTSFFKDKKSKRSHKTVETKVFLTIFDWWWKDLKPDAEPDPYLWLTDPDADPGDQKNIWILRIRIRISNTGKYTWVQPNHTRCHTLERNYPELILLCQRPDRTNTQPPRELTHIPTLWQTVVGNRIRMFLGLPDPDPLVRGMDPDPDPSLFS